MSEWRVVEQIPRTEPRIPASLVRPNPSGFVEHLVIPYAELPKVLKVRAQYVRITSDVAVDVLLDGKPSQGQQRNQLDDLDATTTPPLVGLFNPACDVVFRQEIDELTIRLPYQSDPLSGAGFELVEKHVWGEVHVWIGRGPVESIDWGLPMSFSIFDSYSAGGTTSFVLGPIYPTMHGDNQPAQLGLGGLWMPSRAELWGIEWTPTWSASSGIVKWVRIQWGPILTAYRYDLKVLVSWVAVFRHEFSVPVILPGSGLRETSLNGSEGLHLAFESTQPIASLDLALNFRGWF